MFSIPVTVPVRLDDSVWHMDTTVEIDKIVVVKPLLDKDHSFGVESLELYSSTPSTEIVFEDGRKLPVLETAATINRYLDAYRELEGFYTSRQAAPVENPKKEGVVIPLFPKAASPCDSSEGSTPA